MIAALAIVSANWIVPWATAANLAMPIAEPLGPTMLAFGLAAMLLFTSGLARYTAPGKSVETLGTELLILTYVAVFVSLTVQLRWIDGGKLGYLPLASLVVATKCGDTSAYFTGRAFGKTKLSPLISPGKTRAGAVGAFVGAAAGSWSLVPLCDTLARQRQTGALVLGRSLWVDSGCCRFGWRSGRVADQARRRAKRLSACSLPTSSFGGLLDLLDSVIFTGPVAYLSVADFTAGRVRKVCRARFIAMTHWQLRGLCWTVVKSPRHHVARNQPADAGRIASQSCTGRSAMNGDRRAGGVSPLVSSRAFRYPTANVNGNHH